MIDRKNQIIKINEKKETETQTILRNIKTNISDGERRLSAQDNKKR